MFHVGCPMMASVPSVQEFEGAKYISIFCQNVLVNWSVYCMVLFHIFRLHPHDVLRIVGWQFCQSHLCSKLSCFFQNVLVKFSFSEKATKIWKNLPLVLTLLSKNSCFVKTSGRFFPILWPSHNVLTLNKKLSNHINFGYLLVKK